MLWCEVRVAVAPADVEAAADALRAVAPGGVSIEEPVIPLGPEEGVRLDPHRPALVACYLPVDDRLGARLADVDARLHAAGRHPAIETRRVEEAEWADAWKEHFYVERVGRRLVIRPSWRDYAPLPDDLVIDLDPGMAFGTGQHPTTRRCLVMLEDRVRPGMRVLDLGTGSGILAIAAAKLGAGSVLAVVVEPQAVTVAEQNAARNGVAAVVRVAHGSLGANWPFPEPPVRLADLIVANIHARVLIDLAPAIAAALRPEGVAVASGIIAGREDDVRDAFTAGGLRLVEMRADREWRTLALQSA